MQTIWKGSISFGLVNVPVKMHAATESKEFQFHYLHKECHNRIRYLKKCPHCEAEVSSQDLVKGYEYEKDHYVLLTDEDIASLEQPMTRSIDILDFINLQEIDPVYYQKSYYLSPEETALKAYRLLFQAMQDSGKVALARVTLRSKQHLACLRVFEQGLVLETMYYPAEIRHLDPVWERVVPTETELAMARQLIENLAQPFEPEKYRDEVREQLATLIESKVSGETFKIGAAPEGAKVLDLMEALRASIEFTEKRKGKAEKPAVKAQGRQGTAETGDETAETGEEKAEAGAKSSLTPRKKTSKRAKGA